ncbi:hypothetical protein G9A89_000448 [Geosiphon pyriformis]|nr:hypothetical protein G9A89_000448 [Geosiphon pyriformis]
MTKCGLKPLGYHKDGSTLHPLTGPSSTTFIVDSSSYPPHTSTLPTIGDGQLVQRTNNMFTEFKIPSEFQLPLYQSQSYILFIGCTIDPSRFRAMTYTNTSQTALHT